MKKSHVSATPEKSMNIRLVVIIKLEHDEVGMIREVVCDAEIKVSRVGLPHGSIG